MDKIKKVIDTILKHEGGYQNNPKDAGNRNSKGDLVGTNFGISAPVYEEYFGKIPSASDMKGLKKEEAKEIYKKLYIKPVTNNLGISEDSSAFDQVVDMVVNHGYGNTVPIVQRAVGNIKVDGKSGEGTRAAIEKALKENPKAFNNNLVNERKAFYNAIVKSDNSKGVFLDGWLERANSFFIK